MERNTEYKELRKILLKHIENFNKHDTSATKRDEAKKYRGECIRLALQRKPYLKENEKQYLSRVLKGEDLSPLKIEPVLQFCHSKEDFDFFDFFRLWSSFPTRDRPGRRFKFLLYDEGHSLKPLMALGCLGSSIRQLSVRDEWIGWNDRRFKKIRAKKLAYIMDLNTCIGIPPYSFLTSGKLLCYIILSNEFREMYFERYRNQLTRNLKRIVTDIALVVTCGAYSSNTPQYKGISFHGNNKFKYIGYTKGYSTFHIPQSLYNKLISVFDGPELRFSRYGERGSMAKFQVLRDIARKLNIDEEELLYSGHKRSVFVAPLAQNFREFLLDENKELIYYNVKYDDLVKTWRRQWLLKRWKSSQVRKKVQNFKPEDIGLFSRVK